MTEEITKINLKYPPIISDNKQSQSGSQSGSDGDSGILPLLGLAGIIGFLALKKNQSTQRPIQQPTQIAYPTTTTTTQQLQPSPEEEMRKFEMMHAGLKKRQKMMEEEKKKQTGFQTEINTVPTLIPLRDRLISPYKFGFYSDQGV